MRFYMALAFTLMFGSAPAEDKPILVSAQWLYENLSSPSIIILQSNFLRLDYEREHIEGARFIWPAWLNPDSPEGNMNIADAKDATRILRSLGVSNNSHIVICHVKNEFSIATRLFAALEHYGLRGRISILNGGLEAWKRAGFPVTSSPTVAKNGNVKLKTDPVLVDRQYVLNTMTEPNVVIVDARIKRFYDGEPTGNPRDGHITGAKNIPYADMVDSNNMFRTNDELKAFFDPVAGQDKAIVAYCFIGQTATVVYFAGRLLGYDIKVYDGSIQEWSRIEKLPMEKTPASHIGN